MTARRVIVSGADAGYFRYLKRAAESVRKLDPDRSVDLAILDLGLEPAQRNELSGIADAIVEPGWDYDLPDRNALPSHWRAYTARPHLPRHVPGYDLYLWLDADARVQQWDAVEQLFAGAAGDEAGRAVAIVPEVHPAYRNQNEARDEFETVIRAAFADSFGEETADRLYRRPHLNTGAFALRADAPHWQAWSDALGSALIGHDSRERPPSRERLAEQCAMNVVVYDEGLPAVFLEPRCNWICHHAAPRLDPETGLLTEPLAPFAPLGIVHETMWSKAAP